jgi:hypothetical protein
MEELNSNSKNISENKRKELIRYLRYILNSRMTLTIHREVAAWAITVLYLTALFIFYQLLLKLPESPNYSENDIMVFKILFSVFIIIICFIVGVFIHSQFAANTHSRAVDSVCASLLYKLIHWNESDKIELDYSKWDITNNKYFPKLIQDEVDKKCSEEHKWTKIYPWNIFRWFFLRIFKPNEFQNKTKEFEKLHLIESSIYCLILLPTIFFLLLLSYNFWFCIINYYIGCMIRFKMAIICIFIKLILLFI